MNRFRCLTFGLLAAAGLVTASYVPRLFSNPAPSDVTRPLPPVSEQEYSLQDGKIVSGGNVAATNVNSVTEPGNVEAIDVDLANTIALQQKGGAGKGKGGGSQVYKMSIAPQWFDNNTKFWYRNDLKAGTKEFVLVDLEKGTRLARLRSRKTGRRSGEGDGQAISGAKAALSNHRVRRRRQVSSFQCRRQLLAM